MEMNTIRLAAQPPAGASSVVRTPAPKPARTRELPAPEAVEPTHLLDSKAASAAIEQFRERRLANTPSGVRLQVNASVDRVIAQIVNESNEVIKQIPPEDAVRAFARFREVTGLIFDLEI